MSASGVEFVSRATLSGVCAALSVDRVALSEHLAELGPLRINRPVSARHWVICELWMVCEGRAMTAGLDAAEVATRLASVTAGLAGSVWGAGLGWLAGMSLGNLRSVAAAVQGGARRGYAEASTLAHGPTRGARRLASLGPYHELMLAVPDVSIGSDPQSYTAVLGMVTDDPIALWIDRALGYGYDKHRGTLDVTEPETWSVWVDGSEWLHAELRPSAGKNGIDQVNRWWRQPLLGGLHGERWSTSYLERRIDRQKTEWTALSGSVEPQGRAVPECLKGLHLVGGENEGWALAFRDVGSRISYARRAR